jgi:hypothetical protein
MRRAKFPMWSTVGPPKTPHAHIRFGLYLRILNTVELACEEPRISFHEVPQTRSMDLVDDSNQIASRLPDGGCRKILIEPSGNLFQSAVKVEVQRRNYC